MKTDNDKGDWSAYNNLVVGDVDYLDIVDDEDDYDDDDDEEWGWWCG